MEENTSITIRQNTIMTINNNNPDTIPASTTLTQTRSNDKGRKPKGRQTSIKRLTLLPAPPRRTNIANHQLKTQPVYQIFQQLHNPQIRKKKNNNQEATSQHYPTQHTAATQDNNINTSHNITTALNQIPKGNPKRNRI
ncbi:hypothetical protein CHS0354_004662 [Potamilus streckersoni]|uniref:Uncharacterized protein n=1 Tax=Potamilus streckersoni TaxID=2493646 RepID=A0AAE0S4T5_9BIVA|nr:hypothetical protein CHS0354_004662 [Potamilus streckersoni]